MTTRAETRRQPGPGAHLGGTAELVAVLGHRSRRGASHALKVHITATPSPATGGRHGGLAHVFVREAVLLLPLQRGRPDLQTTGGLARVQWVQILHLLL